MKRAATNRSARIRSRRRRLFFQKMEERQLLAGDVPLGATPVDTGEFLLGTVTVTPVFFESDGSIDPNTQDWGDVPNEIDSTLAKIRESVDWWSSLLATQTDKHSLSFEIDDTYAKNPVSTGFEPIDRSSTTFERYVGNWLTGLGFGDAPSIERAMHLFNDSQRRDNGTDWAFTIFVVDSSNDDGFFASGGFVGAFAYSGGLFSVVPSTRPVSTFSHEMGHIFYARDEYPGAGSWTDERGYYNAQNVNAADNPTAGFDQQVSIMRGGSVAAQAYDNLVSPESTLAMIGWRDSDGDGVFDLADVPLDLDAVGWFDAESSLYTLRGSAAVSTLPNQNSEGMQSDITLARIGALQYSLDDGAWQTVLSPDDTQVDFDVQFEISEPFNQIQWRAIDTSTGITSEVLTGDALTPVFPGIGGGFAYVDQDEDGERGEGEALLTGAQFTLLSSDGSDLYHRLVLANDLPEDVIDSENGLTFDSLGAKVDGRVSARGSSGIQSGRVFHAFDIAGGRWIDQWGAKRQLQVSTEQTTGHVEIDFIALDTGSYGLETGSYARAEAYDADGNLIERVTSDLVLADQQGKLVVEDSLGRIARVVVYGHAETEIRISAVEFGHRAIASMDNGGTFSVDGLPDGSYSVQIVSPNLIYQFPSENVPFTISAGSLAPMPVAAQRVNSPRHNLDLPGDVNGDQRVTPLDALLVINDIARSGNRTLTSDDTGLTSIDVNNDGTVSPRDALRVINLLEQQPGGEPEFVDQPLDSTELPPEPPGQENPSQSPLSSNSPQPAALIGPIGPAAVDVVFQLEDRFFRQDTVLNDLDRQIAHDREKPKMFNSAGEPTSDQSLGDRLSDRSPGEGELTGDRSSSEKKLDHPLSAFPLQNTKIGGEPVTEQRMTETF
jgi:hypothetical protein